MGLVKCPDCGQEISDRASICVKCGCPVDNTEATSGKLTQMWDAVTKARTPINIFALAMMGSASVLGYSATKITGCDARTAFTYTIHAFLAISAMFFLAILFCKKGIYHPEDLAKVKPEVLKALGQDKPGVAAALILLMIIAYGSYQLMHPNPCSDNASQTHDLAQVKAKPEALR